ncbi:hypothetical protein E8E14_004206 [Neopestalotiopsis sp. 37M]|nr:hypothetical protein E8E14_004206 [Neopestalotiopsis sp. 37M]
MASFNLSGPALAAPAGVIPNFEDPPNRNGLAIASFIAMLVIATVCLVLRCYGKFFVAKKMNIEDGLLLAAYGNYWGCTYASFKLIGEPGYFVHNWDLTLGATMEPYYYIFLFGVFYSMVLAMLKIAILVEWCRVFVLRGTERSNYFWWCSMTVIAVQAAFGFAAIFLLNFQCIPHEAIWDFTITDKACLPLNALQLTSATIHLVSDVAIFLLPQKIIWTLNMSLRKRLGVAVVFSLGALTKSHEAYFQIDDDLDDAMPLKTFPSDPSAKDGTHADSTNNSITRTPHIQMSSSSMTSNKEPFDWQ